MTTRLSACRSIVLLTLAAFLFCACATRGKPAMSATSREISTRTQMARVYLEQGKVQESMQLLREVLKEEPRHDGARNLLGLVYWSIGKLPEARAEFERALEANPYQSDARVNLGVVLSESGEYDKANAEFQRVLEDKTYATPEKPLVNLALNEMKQGKTRAAMMQAERAIRRSPGYARAYEVYVQALRQSDAAAASVEFETLVREMDRSLDFHLNLGEAFVKENDRRRARFHLQKAVALGPGSEQAVKARQSLEKLP